MNTVVDRDGHMQVDFGEYIEDFAAHLREQCNKVKGHIDDARDNVKDDAPSDAMDYMEETINTILRCLPDAEAFGRDQIQKGNSIIEAEEYAFKKR